MSVPTPVPETTASRELTEETRLPLKLVVGIVVACLTAAGSYFGLETQVHTANARIDAVEIDLHGEHARVERDLNSQQKITCAIARRVKVDVAECDAPPPEDDTP